MGKAKLKEKEVGNIPEGMQIKDLSPEKRSELYQVELQKFDAEMTKVYGISLSAEISYTPRGIFPRLVLVDTLTKANEQKANPTKENGSK